MKFESCGSKGFTFNEETFLQRYDFHVLSFLDLESSVQGPKVSELRLSRVKMLVQIRSRLSRFKMLFEGCQERQRTRYTSIPIISSLPGARRSCSSHSSRFSICISVRFKFSEDKARRSFCMRATITVHNLSSSPSSGSFSVRKNWGFFQ